MKTIRLYQAVQRNQAMSPECLFGVALNKAPVTPYSVPPGSKERTANTSKISKISEFRLTWRHLPNLVAEYQQRRDVALLRVGPLTAPPHFGRIRPHPKKPLGIIDHCQSLVQLLKGIFGYNAQPSAPQQAPSIFWSDMMLKEIK